MTYSYKYRRKNDSLWHKYLSSFSKTISNVDTQTMITIATISTYLFVIIVGAYFLLRRTNTLPPNAFRKFMWRLFVYMIPASLVLALERRGQNEVDDPFADENSYAATRTFGAKSLAVQKMFGLAAGISSLSVANAEKTFKTHALPGLFNRDNECYQNSVIQGLASLPAFRDFVQSLPSNTSNDHTTLTGALQGIIAGLNSPDNYGRGLWTPYALKSMSSWQQQDAQEYYSRVIDEVEKDVKNVIQAGDDQYGCSSLADFNTNRVPFTRSTKVETSCHDRSNLEQLRNPLEGLQAQRVGCLQCGFVEGLSLIPFNCITVSLGHQHVYDLESLLDDYTSLETISGVECAKCTLTKQERLLQRLAQSRAQDDSKTHELLDTVTARLEAVHQALEEGDFSESTLSKECQISSKARVLTDKTKQSAIARAPQSLIIHINRSVFNERTGGTWKNNAQVRYPKILDLDQWSLGSPGTAQKDNIENWETDPSKSMLPPIADGSEEADKQTRSQALYTLRALITHYGTHGDGHYIAWRQDPSAETIDTNSWWRLSDQDVDEVNEDTILRQGGVFMLFYERLSADELSAMDREIKYEDKNTQQDAKTTVINEALDSPSDFLSPEAKADIDARLGLTPVTNTDFIGEESKVTGWKPRSDRPVPPMRTASEASSIKIEDSRDLLNLA